MCLCAAGPEVIWSGSEVTKSGPMVEKTGRILLVWCFYCFLIGWTDIMRDSKSDIPVIFGETQWKSENCCTGKTFERCMQLVFYFKPGQGKLCCWPSFWYAFYSVSQHFWDGDIAQWIDSYINCWTHHQSVQFNLLTQLHSQLHSMNCQCIRQTVE